MRWKDCKITDYLYARSVLPPECLVVIHNVKQGRYRTCVYKQQTPDGLATIGGYFDFDMMSDEEPIIAYLEFPSYEPKV